MDDSQLANIVKNGELDTLRACLQNKPQEQYNQALSLASQNSHIHLIDWLIQSGADVNYDNRKILINALIDGNIKVVECLLDHGAQLGSSPSYESELCIAVDSGNLDMVKLLIAHGVEVYALNVAMDFQNKEISKFLLDKFNQRVDSW